MKQKTITLCVVLLLCLSTAGLNAQEAVSATGGEASGSGGSASYTIGQLVYTTHTGTTGSVAQGVQQAFEISVVTGIHESENISIFVSAYPNPASDFLTLSIDASTIVSPRLLRYELFDMKGKLLKNKKVTSDKTKITTNDLTPGTYFLKVTDNKIEIKSFKIVKN